VGRSTFGASSPGTSAAISVMAGAIVGESMLASSLFVSAVGAPAAAGSAGLAESHAVSGIADGVLMSSFSSLQVPNSKLTNWKRLRLPIG